MAATVIILITINNSGQKIIFNGLKGTAETVIMLVTINNWTRIVSGQTFW